MPAEATVLLSFPLAAAATLVATPVAIRVASRMQLLDRPEGYKGHGRPTPYLGGAGMLAGIAVGVLWLGGGSWTVVVACAALLCAVGTVDDRHILPVLPRVVVQALVAVAVWASGHGWDVVGWPAADLALTVATVLAVVNATNLMDNMDGAAATTTGVTSACAAALALIAGDAVVGGLCLAVTGACAAFLRFNLARPSRIFMGDGGSMPLGLLAATGAMTAAQAAVHDASAVVVAVLLTGIVALDSTLVTVSRRRAGRPVLSGGRDHLTHRLAPRLGGPARTALALGTAQALLGGLVLVAVAAGSVAVIGLGLFALAGGAVAIAVLDKALPQRAPTRRARARTPPAPSPSGRYPEPSRSRAT